MPWGTLAKTFGTGGGSFLKKKTGKLKKKKQTFGGQRLMRFRCDHLFEALASAKSVLVFSGPYHIILFSDPIRGEPKAVKIMFLLKRCANYCLLAVGRLPSSPGAFTSKVSDSIPVREQAPSIGRGLATEAASVPA